MMIAASAIVAILARRPGAEALLVRLDAARPPLMTTPVALLEAVEGLARAKVPDGVPAPLLIAQSRTAVIEFASVLGLREVPVTAELGRRAGDVLVADGGPPGRALSAAAARAYRVPLLTES